MSAINKAILLTSPGAAAIAVVRIVGPNVAHFLATHFSRRAQESRCVHGELRNDGGAVIDDPVVVILPDNRGADINLHGGPWVVQACLDLARRSGFEINDSIHDPLPLEAFDGASVIESEMLAALPLALTEQAIGTLLEQPRVWQEFVSRPRTRDEITAVLADRSLWFALHPPRVAIVGAPNVGKSTLANQLFAQQRSITTNLPGTTRDWVGELANLDGFVVMLLDTPGIRVTDDQTERAAIERASTQTGRADLVVLVLDVTRPLEEQSDLVAQYPQAIRVANKCDLPKVWDVNPVTPIHVIATTGLGTDVLREAIRSHFGCDHVRKDRPRWWTRRQRELLEVSLQSPGGLATIVKLAT